MNNKEKREEKKLNSIFKQKYGLKGKKQRDKKRHSLSIRKSFKYNIFRQVVKDKAGNCCQLCGKREIDGAVLVVHHMDMVKDKPELILDVKNAICICTICHAEIHPWLQKNSSVSGD